MALLLSPYKSQILEEFPELFQTSKKFQNTQVLCLFENLLTMVCSHHVSLGKVNIEVSCQQVSNFLGPKVCTLMYWHDINIIIMKYWLVFQDISWTMAKIYRRRNSLFHPLSLVVNHFSNRRLNYLLPTYILIGALYSSVAVWQPPEDLFPLISLTAL